VYTMDHLSICLVSYIFEQLTYNKHYQAFLKNRQFLLLPPTNAPLEIQATSVSTSLSTLGMEQQQKSKGRKRVDGHGQCTMNISRNITVNSINLHN
jgi:hypothetical protein